MKLRTNKDELIELRSQNIFLDNDFLSLIFSDEEILENTVNTIPGHFYIDPFVKFEFLRDVFDPEKRATKQKFVDVFNSMPNHPDMYRRIHIQALELSQIYASQRKAKGVSLVDLMLGAQLVQSAGYAYIITGNRKDFPPILFDLVTVLNYEQADDSIRAISILKANTENYKYYKQKLDEITKAQMQKIDEDLSKRQK